MRIALLTPMKPPDHPVPSGDRTFARLIRAALEAGGHDVVLPSTLRTWCRTPDDLAAVEAEASAEVGRIADTWLRGLAPDAILTYHNYHKAPDLLGPPLARLFGCPYAIVEASRAEKRARGPWARGFALADRALSIAGALGAVTEHDAAALSAFAPDKVMRVPPFVDVAPFRASAGRVPETLACAAMLRPGRKADSVRVLADAYARIRAARPGATLTLAGEGPERDALEPLFPPGTFCGLLDQEALADLFARSSLFVWPAIDEPFGFAFLEAQAAGLPVVGGRSPGVVDIVRDGETGILVDPGDPDAIAGAVLSLLDDPARLAAMSRNAAAFAAANDLAAGLSRLTELMKRAAMVGARP
ncbi:glycosyl transferase [Acuticoccus sediminis]|uniref:Glycosyl transferase n=1 Tax=Acuticoccus sediminis TaxID=2184697 RepID=A0A8B2NJ59_9HYPH|nr:glycosyltransferase family 4 protein [Acuticoccus sediminis]RAH99415.1 glycosyl transferase [Acuticoccus sediminis]